MPPSTSLLRSAKISTEVPLTSAAFEFALVIMGRSRSMWTTPQYSLEPTPLRNFKFSELYL